MIIQESREINPGVEFCKKRKEGAKKIAQQAESRGGAARLTQWHFEAKLPAYDECMRMFRSEKKLNDFKSHFNKTHAELRINHLTQEKFQKIMGRLEIFGEVIIFIKQGEES